MKIGLFERCKGELASVSLIETAVIMTLGAAILMTVVRLQSAAVTVTQRDECAVEVASRETDLVSPSFDPSVACPPPVLGP